MRTKDRILDAALRQFNQAGWVNITLRDIAASLNISYGNVTYHFPTKEKLLESIYVAYQLELLNLSSSLTAGSAVLPQLLAAPRATFALSLKYRFLFVDFLELQRQYPAFMAKVSADNQSRKAGWKKQLLSMQQSGILRADIQENTFDFIMELSGMVRTFFFLKVSPAEINLAELEATYVWEVNAVLWPYLSEKGLEEARQAGHFTDK